MKLIEALLAAGLVWAMAGCGAAVNGLGNRSAGGGMVLADETGGECFLLSVAGGALDLVAMNGTGAVAASDPELIDGVTGGVYSVAVNHGALTLAPATAGVAGLPQIEFVDAVTEKPYALAVVRGGLTLIPG